MGNKFQVGQTGNKKDKYVEAAGTNLFFAVYEDKNNKRSYETIPLNEVIERQNKVYLWFDLKVQMIFIYARMIWFTFLLMTN